jgi:cell division protein FtsQ
VNEKKKNAVVLAVLLICTLALVVGANTWKSGLRATQFVVGGNRIVSRNEIVQLMEVEKGASLYETDLTAIQRNVESHYYIKQATVERDLPNTIRVQVQERLPLTLINGDGLKYLDAEGVVLPHTDSRMLFDLPILSGIASSVDLSPGVRVSDEEVREALDILLALKIANRELFHRISEVELHRGGDIVLYAAEGGVPILFGRGDIANKLVRLETFWYTTVIVRGVQNLQYVDVRYEDQIIARWNGARIPGRS